MKLTWNLYGTEAVTDVLFDVIPFPLDDRLRPILFIQRVKNHFLIITNIRIKQTEYKYYIITHINDSLPITKAAMPKLANPPLDKTLFNIFGFL